MELEAARRLSVQRRELERDIKPTKERADLSPWVWFEKIGERIISLLPEDSQEASDGKSQIAVITSCRYGQSETVAQVHFPLEHSASIRDDLRLELRVVSSQGLSSQAIHSVRANWFDNQGKIFEEQVLSPLIVKNEATKRSLGLLDESVLEAEALRDSIIGSNSRAG